MKNLFLVLLLTKVAYCQSSGSIDEMPSGLITPALFFPNSGLLTVKADSLLYMPNKDCYRGNVMLNKIFACNNYLIKPIKISWADVKAIKRRNLYLIFPNRLLVVMADGTKYKFFQYHRNKVIGVFDNYKKQIAAK